MKEDAADRKQEDSWPSTNAPNQEKAEQDMKLWVVFLFGLIGATATTFAVGRLRRTVDWFYAQLSRSQSSWKEGPGSSFRSAFQEEAWKRYNKRLQEEYEEEMERVERIRRMQSVFNRERNKYKRSYDSWRENGPGAYHQHFQRDDWYWKTDASYRDWRTNYRETPRETGSYSLSHHYSVLGLDRYFYKSSLDPSGPYCQFPLPYYIGNSDIRLNSLFHPCPNSCHRESCLELTQKMSRCHMNKKLL